MLTRFIVVTILQVIYVVIMLYTLNLLSVAYYLYLKKTEKLK